MYLFVKMIPDKNLYKSLFIGYLYKNVRKCKIRSREDMLLYQGVLAFELFTNTKADEKLVEAMRKGLKGE
ncbi:hypothetical protein [Arcobacter ellisii]|uniref:hypothetical protein n=1 Tax=Arcobacter ellisii TaxID=913109 RepID=UPI0013E96AE2|nr:hypothetical protein [Arcobacter ellisii]